jgi:ATP-binding cassette subfamily B protein
MKLLYQYLKNFWPLVILALLLAAVNQVFSLLDPYVFRLIIDKYLNNYKQFTNDEFFKGVIFYIFLAMGAAMVSRIAKNFQDYFVNVIVQKLGAKIYEDGLKHSLELPYQVFEDQRSGETLGILQKVRTDVEKLVNASVNILFTSIVGVIFVLVYSISLHWLIAPVYFSAIPVLGILSSFLSKKIKKVQKIIVGETTALAGSTTESLRNIELVKSLGLAQQEIKRLNTTTEKILKLELKKVRYVRSLSFVQGTFVNLMRNLILLMMLYLVFKDKITIGQMFSLFIYSFYIFGPLQELGNIISIYRETEVSLKNFENILNTPKESRPDKEKELGALQSITFERVSFKHLSATTNALQDINIGINKGETIAFVGPSGSGKTTLVKLLVGLYRPVEGDLKYNNISVKDVNIDKLREQIGFVTQDTQLFSGTIKENLLFVKPNASDAECMDVLKKAACDNLMKRALSGLDTLIGEGGVKVSGGERQRLSIARALLRNPQLMIFDEATSALDSLTEEEITETIKEISQQNNQITVLIAHRLSTVMHANRIFVLEHGKVIETGKHQELLDQKGLYYAMWRQQIGERKKSSVLAEN